MQTSSYLVIVLIVKVVQEALVAGRHLGFRLLIDVVTIDVTLFIVGKIELLVLLIKRYDPLMMRPEK